MRISDWSSDVCSSDRRHVGPVLGADVGGDAADVHDRAATAGHHHRQHGAAHEEGAVEDDGHDLAPLAVTHLGERHLAADCGVVHQDVKSEEHTSELQSLMRISYAVFCLKKKKTRDNNMM